ncbi:MAG: hypothetical protein LBB15_00695, partial [Puniceicoccales bacterium]|nr:hypothetical protein [Puniceicoccales bacterium]
MDINNILSKLSYLQDTTRGTSIARNAYVPVVAAGMAKFTRAFHNLCDDLVKLNPTSVFALFGNDELHAIVSDVALEAREAADPQHHGDTRKFVDQIQLMIAEEWGAPKEAIFDPNAQGEMIASMRTLASEESVESLGNMCAIFA